MYPLLTKGCLVKDVLLNSVVESVHFELSCGAEESPCVDAELFEAPFCACTAAAAARDTANSKRVAMVSS